MQQTGSDTAYRSIDVKGALSYPISTVWDAWTNPDQIAQWWGPEGFTNTIHHMDLKPGGEWRLTMHGPDGKRYPNKSMFLEMLPLEKIVFEHYNPNYLATVTFTAEGKQTVVDWTMVFETIELFETVVKVFKADEGLQQNMNKLERFLSNQQPQPSI